MLDDVDSGTQPRRDDRDKVLLSFNGSIRDTLQRLRDCLHSKRALDNTVTTNNALLQNARQIWNSAEMRGSRQSNAFIRNVWQPRHTMPSFGTCGNRDTQCLPASAEKIGSRRTMPSFGTCSNALLYRRARGSSDYTAAPAPAISLCKGTPHMAHAALKEEMSRCPDRRAISTTSSRRLMPTEPATHEAMARN